MAANIFGRKILLPKTFLAEKNFGQNIFRPKMFSAEKFFGQKNSRPKCFSAEILFVRKIFQHKGSWNPLGHSWAPLGRIGTINYESLCLWPRSASAGFAKRIQFRRPYRRRRKQWGGSGGSGSPPGPSDEHRRNVRTPLRTVPH